MGHFHRVVKVELEGFVREMKPVRTFISFLSEAIWWRKEDRWLYTDLQAQINKN